MKAKHLRFAVVLAVAGLAVCIGAVATQRIVEGEKTLPLAEVPDAVRATILAQAQGNTINEIEMETVNGRTIYEAEVVAGGRTTDIKVAADGALVGTESDEDEDNDADEADEEEGEDEQEELVSVAQVPEAVKATIAKEAAGAEIEEIEKETENGRTFYSVEVLLNGQKVDFEMAPDGTLLGQEVDDESDDK